MKKTWQLIGMVVLAGFWVVVQWPDDKLHLVFCDVGQGDAQLIVKGSVQILVDTGPSDAKIMECLSGNMPFWDRTIEVVANTHPQKDHFGGLDEILRRYEVEMLVVNGVAGEGDWLEEIIGLVEERRIEIFVPEAGDSFKFGDMSLSVLWPEVEVGSELAWKERDENVLGAISDLNEVSIVMRLDYFEFTAILTGDIGVKEEQALVDSGVITPVEILKVAHHGSKYSSMEKFVEAAKPDLAVIQVGGSNSYGHPNGDTMKRFDAVGSEIMRTDINGEVDVVSDGQKWWVE